MLDVSESVANNLYYWSNLLLLFAAALVLIGTIGVIWTGSVRDKYAALAQSQNAAKIATANEGAAKANEGLAKANLDIVERKQENLELQGQVATLEKQTADAKTAQLEMEKSLEDTRADTTRALRTAFNEEMERHGVENTFKARTLSTFREKEFRELLQTYTGTKFYVVTAPEIEPWRTGRMLEKLLIESGWTLAKPIATRYESDDFTFDDAVSIDITPWDNKEHPLWPALRQLEEILKENDIDCEADFAGEMKRPAGLEQDAVRVVVGPRTTWHFDVKKHHEDTKKLNLVREYQHYPRRSDDELADLLKDDPWKTISKADGGGQRVAITCFDDEELYEFESKLSDAMKAGGWIVTPIFLDDIDDEGQTTSRGLMSSQGRDDGIRIWSKKDSPKEFQTRAKAVFDMLVAAGLNPKLETVENYPLGPPVCIIIGTLEAQPPNGKKPAPTPSE